MADNINPELTPEIISKTEAPLVDEGLRKDLTEAMLKGLEERGLIEGKTPEEIARLTGEAAALSSIDVLKIKGKLEDPGDESERAAGKAMGGLLVDFQEHGGGTSKEQKVVYSANIDEEAIQKTEQAKDAFHDPLTGILNLRGFQKRLDKKLKRIREQEESEEPRPVALALVDMNGLTDLNNTKGHAAGDKAIQGAADVLTKTTRTGDIVARTGGDEFWVLICETEPDKGLVAGKRAQEPSGSSAAKDASDSIKSFSARAAAGTVEKIAEIERDTGIGLYDLELAIGGVPWDESKTFEEMYEEADAEMYRDKEAKYAAKGKVHLKERNSKSEHNRLELLREQIVEIDGKLASGSVSKDYEEDMLDQREALRLMMVADALTTNQNDPLPPIMNDLQALKYLRPSMKAELDERIAQLARGDGSADLERKELELLRSIIQKDKGSRVVAKLLGENRTWTESKSDVPVRVDKP